MIKITKRISWIDFFRGIFGVVLGYSALTSMTSYACIDKNLIFELLNYLIFLFVMPSFFFISGFLYKKLVILILLLLCFIRKVVLL